MSFAQIQIQRERGRESPTAAIKALHRFFVSEYQKKVVIFLSSHMRVLRLGRHAQPIINHKNDAASKQEMCGERIRELTIDWILALFCEWTSWM